MWQVRCEGLLAVKTFKNIEMEEGMAGTKAKGTEIERIPFCLQSVGGDSFGIMQGWCKEYVIVKCSKVSHSMDAVMFSTADIYQPITLWW